MAPWSLPTVNLMHPTLVARPFHHAGWIYEEKVDGWRMVAIKGKHGVRLISRKGHDHRSASASAGVTHRSSRAPREHRAQRR